MVHHCVEKRYTHREIEGWNVCLAKVMFGESLLEGTNKGNDVVDRLTEDLKTIKTFLPDRTATRFL